MKNLEEISNEGLRREIANTTSVGYLLGMREELERRQDMGYGQKEYYALLVEKRIGKLVFH